MHPKKPQTDTARSDENAGVEFLFKDVVSKMTKAAYHVALNSGFRGSFVEFLADLQQALERVVLKDKPSKRSPSAVPSPRFH